MKTRDENPRIKPACVLVAEDNLCHDLAQPDSALIPESTLEAFLRANTTDLSAEVTLLANENGWTARRLPEQHWLFERKVS